MHEKAASKRLFAVSIRHSVVFVLLMFLVLFVFFAVGVAAVVLVAPGIFIGQCATGCAAQAGTYQRTGAAAKCIA